MFFLYISDVKPGTLACQRTHFTAGLQSRHAGLWWPIRPRHNAILISCVMTALTQASAACCSELYFVYIIFVRTLGGHYAREAKNQVQLLWQHCLGGDFILFRYKIDWSTTLNHVEVNAQFLFGLPLWSFWSKQVTAWRKVFFRKLKKKRNHTRIKQQTVCF